MSPVVDRGKVYFGDTAGMLYVLDAANGRVDAAYEYQQPFTSSSPLILGKTLVIANTSELHALPLGDL